ncbi:MAG TPA: hypothetical protein VII73_09445 [Caulobacteraceae bacterium]
MAEIRLAMVNGTGPAGAIYDEVMQASFCHQLTQKLNTRSFYRRGPRLLGQEVKDEARAVYRWLKAANEQDPTIRLMVAGYSRGGSAAIMACEMLERDNIAVDSLFLFDAVARHEFAGGTVIPANVRFSRHARRCHAASFVEKYEGTLARGGLVGGFENPIRPMFGNTGLTWRGDGDHQPAEPFLGSHGALGGVGWRFVVEDKDCERQVAAWMNDHFAARGVEVALEAFSPKGESAVTHPSNLEKWLMHNVYHFALHGDDENLLGKNQDQPPTAPERSAARSG